MRAVGGLSHYIEKEGVATAGISLIREHTEKIKPPRSLWVPFDLGRPLGVPGDHDFQIDVLRTLLRLFEREAGPVLADYPHDAPHTGAPDVPWTCALPLPPLAAAQTPLERLQQALQIESSYLKPWYNEAIQQTGRTAFGLSGLTADDVPAMVAFVAGWAVGEELEPPAGVKELMPQALRSIVDDLKSFYFEAASTQPGGRETSSAGLNRWLYHDTRLGEALYDIRDRFAALAAADPQRRGPAVIPNVFRMRPSPD